MATVHLFPTVFYSGQIADAPLLADIERSCRQLAIDDGAGAQWSEDNRYLGYTSYASLNDLPVRDPAFAALKTIIDRHVAQFAAEAHFNLAGGGLVLDSFWVNILEPPGGHSGHIHPHSSVSGTVYITVPEGAGRLRLEDPRLPMMMAAPGRTADSPAEHKPFFYADPAPGTIFLWESWLRHEVEPNWGDDDRISVSFNYR